MPNDGVFYTVKLNIKRIQEEEDFIDDSFNAVIDDIDNKVVGISHLTSGAHWHIWEANTAYAVGDVIRWPAMKSHQYAKCIQAGNTDSVRPTVNVNGSEVTSGTTKWKIVSLTSTSDVNGGAIQIWQGGGSLYERGDAVLYASSLYRCKVASHKSSNNFEDDKDNWQEIYASVRPWEDNKFYYENDVVIVGLFLYKCLEDHTSANDFDLPVEKEKWRMVGDVSNVREWEVDTDYMENQLVTIGGILYRSLYTHVSDSDSVNNDADFWEPLFASISSWRFNYYYSAGSVVLANNILYRCIEPHVSSSIFSFDYDKWELLHVLPANVYDWDTDTTYAVNQVVKYDGNLYRVISNHISAVDFDPTKFELLTDSINDWIGDMNYKVGQYVNYNGSLYKCLLDNNDDDFNPANWQKVSGSIDQWESDFDYSVGDIVINANKIYKCNTAHTSSSTFTSDADNWTEISACITRIPNWEVDTDYVVGDLVAHDAKIYRCITAHTSDPNEWDDTEESKWEELSPTVNEISTWAVSTDYEIDQLVIRNNKLYRCNTDHTSDSVSFNADIEYWDLIGSNGIDTWKSGEVYQKGSVVLYNDKIYFCDTGHISANPFDYTKWHEISSSKLYDWQQNTSYHSGDYAVYDYKIYKCTNAHTSSSEFDPSKWVEISSYDIDLWKTDTGYKIGNLVIYNDKIYRCNTDHTSDSSSFDVDIDNWTLLNSQDIKLWSTSTKYNVGNNVIHNNKLYRCKIKHTSDSATFNADITYWDEIGSTGIDTWKSNEAYNTSSVVIYDNKIYKCNTIHTSDTTFDQTKWDEISPSDISLWNTDTYYRVGNLVIEDNQLYRCKTAHTSDSDEFSADINKWDVISTKMFWNTWNTESLYLANEMVNIGANWYKAKDSHVSCNTKFEDDFDAHWELIDKFDDWESGKPYRIGTIVRKDGKLFKCTASTSSGVFDPNSWELYLKCVEDWHPNVNGSGNILVYVDFEYTIDGTPYNYYSDVVTGTIERHGGDWNVPQLGTGGLIGSSYGSHTFSTPSHVIDSSNSYTVEFIMVDHSYNSGNFAEPYNNHLYLNTDKSVYVYYLASPTHKLCVNIGTYSYDWEVAHNGGENYFIHALAFTFTSTGTNLFVDGVLVLETDYVSSDITFNIHAGNDARTSGIMLLDELLITKGVLYSSDYSPSYNPRKKPVGYSYEVGDLVVYDNNIYQCVKDNSDGKFDYTKWKLLGVKGKGIVEWKITTNYSEDDLVIYEDEFYRCNSDHVSTDNFVTDFRSDKWTKLTTLPLLDVTADGSTVVIPKPKYSYLSYPYIEVFGEIPSHDEDVDVGIDAFTYDTNLTKSERDRIVPTTTNTYTFSDDSIKETGLIDLTDVSGIAEVKIN